MQKMRRLSSWLAILLLVSSFAQAEQLRVTTWKLRWFPAGIPSPVSPEVEDQRIGEIASLLKALNSDVIVLQDVRDAQSCRKLAERLDPNSYRVAICSDFLEMAGGPLDKRQMAILSRKPILSASAQPWQAQGAVGPPGGAVYALIQTGTQLVGIYGIHLKNNTIRGDFERDNQLNILQREISAEQLLRLVTRTSQFGTNVVESFVVAGNFNTCPDQSRYVSEETLRMFQDAGWKSGFERVPAAKRVTCPGKGRYPDVTFDYVFAKGLGFVTPPVIQVADRSDHYPVTADLLLSEAPTLATVRPKVESAAPAPIAQENVAVAKPQASKTEAANQTSIPSEQNPAPTPQRTIVAKAETNVQTPVVDAGNVAEVEYSSPPTAVVMPVAQARPKSNLLWWLAGIILFSHVVIFLVLRSYRFNEQSATFAVGPYQGDPSRRLDLADEGQQVHERLQEGSGWQARALAAEQRAHQATALARSKLLPHFARMMMERVVGALLSQRSHLLTTQNQAAAQVARLEERLVKIQEQMSARVGLYEKRIAELEKELASKEAQNRELLLTTVGLTTKAFESSTTRKPAEEKTAN